MMIRELREARGWSQAELAARTGLDQTTISRAEHGFEGTTLRVLKAIAGVFSVSVSDLLMDHRSLSELRLLRAFRELPESQQLVWVQLAEAIAPNGQEVA